MGVPTYTCEIAFATDPGATPTWTDVSEFHRSTTIRRGRNHELDRVEAGTATIRLRNGDGRFDPTNLSSPYSPNVRPMRRVRVRATWEGVTYDRFNGYIEDWPQAWTQGPAGDAWVQVHAVDAFKVLALAKVSTTRSAEGSGARVGAILDEAGWPGAPNLLTVNQASLETDTTGWSAETNCSIARTTTQALHGTASLQETATGAGTMGAVTPASPGVAVVADRTYTAVASFRAGATARTCRVYLNWLDASHVFMSNISGSVGDTTSGWNQASISGVAPVGAAFASVAAYVEGCAASEVHYVDQIMLHLGVDTDWTLPGVSSNNYRTVDTGLSTVQGVTLLDEPALSHLQQVELTEGGLLFVSRDGKITFLDRTKPITTVLDEANLTWGDSGLEKDYADLSTSFDDSQIWNDAKATAPGKTDQSTQDTASQTRYFRRTRVDSGLWDSENEMKSRTEYVVARFGEPALRITGVDLSSARGQDIQWPHILPRELHDKVRLRKRPVGGGTISQDSFIEGTTETIRQGVWDIVWNASPLDRTTDYFIWDQSRWGVDTRWYW